MSSCFNPNPFLSLDRTEIPSPRVSTNLDQTTLPSVGPSRTRRSGRRSSLTRLGHLRLTPDTEAIATGRLLGFDDDETPWATVALDPSVRRASPSDQPSAMQGKILLAQQEPASEQTAPTQPPPPLVSVPNFIATVLVFIPTAAVFISGVVCIPQRAIYLPVQIPIPEPSKPVVTSVPHEPWSGSGGSQVSGKIPKPVGEVGRPKRGGYNLEKTLDWPASLFSDVKREIKVLVYEKMDCRTGFAHQPQSKIEYVHEEALALYPWLDRYEKLWVVDDFIRGHLKYRKSALQREDDAQRHIQAQERIQELESRRKHDHGHH
ncbi:hypothetical protein BDZ89DRAFT_1148437 [Hymenopellis radicata]|nr:hypothetical protein BDZ89DRAFT_1148437 [Hymenopellis radicata]